MAKSPPRSPRSPADSGPSPFEDTAHLLRTPSTKRSLLEDLRSNSNPKWGIDPGVPPPRTFLGADLRALQAQVPNPFHSPRLGLLLGITLCVAAVWLGAGAWQAKCCLCAKVRRERLREPQGRPRNFVYVYDLGPEYTDVVRRLEPWWYADAYDVERLVTEALLSSNQVRTTNPDEASLFFVPFYSARYTLYHFREKAMNMAQAVRNTSAVWEGILRGIRRDYPYFNRSHGRDHFGVLALDQGRCSGITFVDPSLYGEMFFLQLNGDRVVRSTHAHPRLNLQFLSYRFDRRKGPHVNASIPDIPCYMAGRDIVVPPFSRAPLVPPQTGPRDVRVLFQFQSLSRRPLAAAGTATGGGGGGGVGGAPLAHHGHDATRELLRLFQGLHVEGWEVGEQEEAEAEENLRRALLCVAPPGLAQWTPQLPRGALSGCLPVTVSRDNDWPWANELDYEQFSIQLDFDDLPVLQTRLIAVLASPPRLEAMQRALAAAQPSFRWSGSFQEGAEAMLLRELQGRAMRLRRPGKRKVSTP